jgi:exopolysaccharide biosynthesis polyprenyl glycosylphosphotransferase
VADLRGNEAAAQTRLARSASVAARIGVTRFLSTRSSPGLDLPEGKSIDAALKRDTLYRRALAFSDILAASLSILIAIVLVQGDSPKPLMVIALPLWVLAGKAAGIYDRDQHLIRKTTLEEVPAIFQIATLFTLASWLVAAPLANMDLYRRGVGGLLVSLFVTVMVLRAVTRRVATHFAPTERCLVLGSPELAERIQSKLHHSPHVRAEVIGRVPLSGPDPTRRFGPPVLGTKDTLGLAIAEQDVERVIIAPSGDDTEEILDGIRLVKALGVKVSVVPRLLEVVGSTSEFDEVDGISLLGVRRYGLTRSSEVMKRGFDILMASLALIVIAPLLLGLAIAVKLGSRGPVFFRQPRIWHAGRSFSMLKFRSMYDGADAHKAALQELNESEGGLFKIADDPRVTRVGKLIRETSLDELPQLLNVIRGDMSLVGPRPLVPDEDAMIEGWQRRRLQVRPGMTGLWQIFGSARIPMSEMVKIDYLYGANWSLWGDVKILMRTIPYIIARRGM